MCAEKATKFGSIKLKYARLRERTWHARGSVHRMVGDNMPTIFQALTSPVKALTSPPGPFCFLEEYSGNVATRAFTDDPFEVCRLPAGKLEQHKRRQKFSRKSLSQISGIRMERTWIVLAGSSAEPTVQRSLVRSFSRNQERKPDLPETGSSLPCMASAATDHSSTTHY